MRSNSSRPFAQAALIRTQPAPAPPLRPVWALRTAAQRWYSEKADTATKKEGDGETSQAEAQAEEAAPKTSDAEAELKKKLETKEKEAIDWKVGHIFLFSTRSQFTDMYTDNAHRTSTSAPSPNSATSRTGHSAR